MNLLQGQIEQQEIYCADISQDKIGELTYLEKLVNNYYLKCWLLPEWTLLPGTGRKSNPHSTVQSMRAVLGDLDFHYNKNKLFKCIDFEEIFKQKTKTYELICIFLVVSF